MIKKRQPKKHHFLPQFYLGNFKIDSKRTKEEHVWVASKKNDRMYLAAIKDAGCESDFHTILSEAEEQDRKTIESELSKIEGQQARLITEICEKNSVEEKNREDLNEFISIMRLRVPSYKDFIDVSLQEVVKSSFSVLHGAGKLPKPPKEIEDMIKDGKIPFEVDVANREKLRYMFLDDRTNKGSKIFRQMKMQLIVAAKGEYFITGDTPVGIYHPNYSAIKPLGVGPMTPGVEVTFPLTKKHLVFLSWEGNEGICEASRKDMVEYNRRTIIMSKEYIYSCEKEGILRQIKKCSGMQAGHYTYRKKVDKGYIILSRFIPVTESE